MLRVTVEFLPGGQAHNRKTIGVLTISNVSQLAAESDYAIEATDVLEEHFPSLRRKKGVVRGHRRDAGAWPLVMRAMLALLKERP